MTQRAVRALDRIVEPSSRRNFLAFLGDFVLFGAGISFVNPSTVLPALVRQLTDSAPLIGLVEAIRGGIWFLPQLFAAWFLSGTVIGRRHMVLPFIASRFSLLLVVPILLVLAPGNPKLAVGLLLACLTLYFVCDACGSLPWYDLFSHLLPPVGRTRLMGMGQFLSGGVGIGTGIAVAAILGASTIDFPADYALLFLIASSLFAMEVWAISRVRSGRTDHKGERVPLPTFFRGLLDIVRRDTRFRAFLGFRLLVGTAGVAMPFYMICALDRLQLSVVSVGIFSAAQVAGGIACAPLLALLAERRGPTAVIRVAAGLGVLLPLYALGMLLLGPGMTMDLRVALFALVFVVMGAMNNGVATGFTNYLLDIAPPEARTTYVGFANTFNGLILFMPLIGGVILGGSSWVALFLVTAAAATAGLIGTLRMVPSRSPTGETRA